MSAPAQQGAQGEGPRPERFEAEVLPDECTSCSFPPPAPTSQPAGTFLLFLFLFLFLRISFKKLSGATNNELKRRSQCSIVYPKKGGLYRESDSGLPSTWDSVLTQSTFRSSGPSNLNSVIFFSEYLVGYDFLKPCFPSFSTGPGLVSEQHLLES